MSDYEEEPVPDMVWVAEELIGDLRTIPMLLDVGSVSKEKTLNFVEDMTMILEELCAEVVMLRRREASMNRLDKRWESLKKARRGLHRVEVSDEICD